MKHGPSLKAVLFDLDGTLLDTAPDFAVVLEQMCSERNLPAVPYERVRETVSNGARALIEMAFNLSPGDAGFDAALKRLLELYNHHLGVATVPFDGIIALLQELERNSIRWGVVTNKPEWLAAPLLRSMNIKPDCSTLICPDHVTNKKPHPEPILLACSQLQIQPEEAIYIGDHVRDIDAGRAAGMATIAAAWGYIGAAERIDLWMADHIHVTPHDTLDLLNKHFL